MTRRHFEALAYALNHARTCWAEHPADDYPEYPDPMHADGSICPEQDQWRRTVKAVADTCSAENGRFDRGRFYRAAGLDR